MDLKQVIIVNKDLGMRAGKTAVQCCHGEVLYMEDLMSLLTQNKYLHVEPSQKTLKMFENFTKWRQKDVNPIGTMSKIIKKATHRELLEIMHMLDKEGDIKYYPVYDLGKTQVKEGSLTCVCIEPLEIETVNELFGELKLL